MGLKQDAQIEARRIPDSTYKRQCAELKRELGLPEAEIFKLAIKELFSIVRPNSGVASLR